MKTKIVKTAVLVVYLVVSSLQADTVWLSGHHQIGDGDVYGEIWMYNDATVDILGGEIFKLEAFDVSAVDILGGQMDLLVTHNDSTVNIYAGTLGALGAIESSSVDLYAYDVTYHPTGGYYDSGWIEGTYLANDLYFQFDLGASDTYSHITVVPEPATLFLLALGALLTRDCLHKTGNYNIIESA